MKRFSFAAAIVLAAGQAFAQCGSNGGGQCGAPAASSLPAAQQLTQLQFSNGLTFGGATAASSVAASPAATFAAPQGLAAYSTAVNPAQVYLMLPAANPTQPVALTGGVAAGYQLFPLAAFPGAPAAASVGGASAAASASTSAPAAAAVVPAPTPVNVALTSAAGGCASGQCSARGGLLSRLRRPAQRSSSRSVSLTRSRVR